MACPHPQHGTSCPAPLAEHPEYIRGLEDAARAVCRYCLLGHPVAEPAPPNSEWLVHVEPNFRVPCAAAAIRMLLPEDRRMAGLGGGSR